MKGAQFLLDARLALDVLSAADRIGLFAALSERPFHADALSRRCDLVPSRMRRLLRALEVLSLAQFTERGWISCGPVTAVRGLLVERDLVAALRSGPAVDASVSEDAAVLYQQGAIWLARMMAEPAAELAPSLSGLGPDVLELGAGAMPWGLALGDEVSLTGVDLPAVVHAVRDWVANQADVSWIEGDLFTVPLPKDHFDLVLVPNLLHLFSPSRNEALLRRAVAVTRRGGCVAIIDALRADGEPADRSRALYDMSLASRTGEGRVYDEAELRNWLKTVGLTPTTRVRTDVSPRMDLLLAVCT